MTDCITTHAQICELPGDLLLICADNRSLRACAKLMLTCKQLRYGLKLAIRGDGIYLRYVNDTTLVEGLASRSEESGLLIGEYIMSEKAGPHLRCDQLHEMIHLMPTLHTVRVHRQLNMAHLFATYNMFYGVMDGLASFLLVKGVTLTQREPPVRISQEAAPITPRVHGPLDEWLVPPASSPMASTITDADSFSDLDIEDEDF